MAVLRVRHVDKCLGLGHRNHPGYKQKRERNARRSSPWHFHFALPALCQRNLSNPSPSRKDTARRECAPFVGHGTGKACEWVSILPVRRIGRMTNACCAAIYSLPIQKPPASGERRDYSGCPIVDPDGSE